MILGDLILKMNGDAYCGPTIARSTMSALFAVQVTNMSGSPTLSVVVQHRNRDDVAWGTAASFTAITTDGKYQAAATGLKELIRYTFTITAGPSTSGACVFAAAPQWLVD